MWGSWPSCGSWLGFFVTPDDWFESIDNSCSFQFLPPTYSTHIEAQWHIVLKTGLFWEIIENFCLSLHYAWKSLPDLKSCFTVWLCNCLSSFRSTCWVGFVMTLCWNTFRCTVSPRGQPSQWRRRCNCLSIGRGQATWSTMDSCTAIRQTRPTKYWRCVTMTQSQIAFSEIEIIWFDCIAHYIRVDWDGTNHSNNGKNKFLCCRHGPLLITVSYTLRRPKFRELKIKEL